MKIIEKALYGGVVFIALYAILVAALRGLQILPSYQSHMVAGGIATVTGVGFFLFLLLRKKN